MGGLALGQVGMNPEPVSGQQVGHLGDGQCDVAALDVDIHLGSGEIEGRAVGMQPVKPGNAKQESNANNGACTLLYESRASDVVAEARGLLSKDFARNVIMQVRVNALASGTLC